MWPNLQFLADLVTFTEEIFNGQLHLLRSVYSTFFTFVRTMILREGKEDSVPFSHSYFWFFHKTLKYQVDVKRGQSYHIGKWMLSLTKRVDSQVNLSLLTNQERLVLCLVKSVFLHGEMPLQSWLAILPSNGSCVTINLPFWCVARFGTIYTI